MMLIPKFVVMMVLAASLLITWLPAHALQELGTEIPALVIGGFSIPIIVYLIITAAKYVGLLHDGNAVRWANMILSLVFGGVWLLVQLRPEYESIIVMIITALVGSLGSALIHTLLGDRSPDADKRPGGAKQPN